MIYLDDIEEVVRRNLPDVKASKRDMLMLAMDLNILHERVRDALYQQHTNITRTIIRDERLLCAQKCFRWKILTVVGWAIALGSLLTLSIMGI